MKNKIYGFFHNSSLCESAPALISLHKLKENAKIAMEIHKQKELDEFNEMMCDLPKEEIGYDYDFDKDWFVQEIEILE